MSEEKQDRTRQYLRSWRSARRVVRGIAERNAGSVVNADVTTSPLAANVKVEGMENSFEWEDDLEHDLEHEPEDDLGDDVEIDLEDGLEESTDVDSFGEDLEEPWEDDLEESDQEINTSLSADLAAWACQFQVKHNAVDDLLKILRSHGHTDLPSCSRTLLKTPREVKTTQKSGMEYVHSPVKEKLHDNLMRYPTEQVPDCIDLSFNIDGLPLFKSSGKTMWPILCAVHLKPVSVFPITLTCGGSKPQDLNFLDDMVTDINDVLSSGLQYRDRTVTFNILCIVCDAPAKAFIKNVKLCSGYYGCDRCVQRGEWHEKVTYQETEFVARTDESFRQQRQSEHHRGSTPLLNLPINMIRSFPVDYMHQACLGVMKRLLFCWCRGQKGWRMSATQLDEVSKRLLDLQRFIPSTFTRKPRGLQELERWKATEFRQFMLYTGKVVLKGMLRDDLYGHFMSFSVAMCILVSPTLVQRYSVYASDLMKFFVKRGRELMYEVVEFPEEGLVGIVAHNWTYKEKGEMYSYWPPAHPSKRAKALEIPDTKNWVARKIRVFSTTGDWETALRRCKRAEYKSNIETEEEERINNKRAHKQNSKYMDSSEDDEPRQQKQPKHKKAKGMPQHAHATAETTRSREPTLPPPPAWSNLGTSHNSSIEPRGFEENCISRHPGDRAENVPTWARNIQDTLQVLLRKMETLEENQREAIQLLRRTSSDRTEAPVMELEVAQTELELQDLEERLKASEYRKKVVSHLSLISGTNPGECVRRVMRAIATNLVWSSYSLRGKKGKMALLGTLVCMTIKQAVMKWKPGLGEKTVEVLIAETLKHAPSAHLKAQAQQRGQRQQQAFEEQHEME
ncbi:hypothetical protein GJAV_G00009230 [Gymnothorax javanicus]|nr:hypothetical protein GJAV_G00009230 [Gymnothorax javanicus]